MIDYSLNFVSPVRLEDLRDGWPRPDWDTFNAPRRNGYNPDYSQPGDLVGHKGVDLGSLVLDCGVVAPMGGTVRRAYQTGGDAGGLVEIWHPTDHDVYLTRNMHFEAGDILVASGQEVQAGDPIGIMGKAGNANYDHTHFEIRWSPNLSDMNSTIYGSLWGTPLDPLDFGILSPKAQLATISAGGDRYETSLNIASFDWQPGDVAVYLGIDPKVPDTAVLAAYATWMAPTNVDHIGPECWAIVQMGQRPVAVGLPQNLIAELEGLMS